MKRSCRSGVDEFTASAKVLEQSLGSKEYLCGRLTVADFDVAPYAALAESCGLDLAAYPKTAAWLARMLARDSMKATMAAASGAALKPFEALVEPHRALLRLHCYRMLGSSHDSDDMVQETLVRAFRAQDTLHDPASARAWLHRIATNVCLDELARRPAPRTRCASSGRPPTRIFRWAPRTPDSEWLEPVPSSWLQVPAPEGADPAAQYTLKESVALAFVAALQVLTPSQRAVLLLRDVVGLSAAETAEALACSVPSANSALHRARVTLEERVGAAGELVTGGGRCRSRAPRALRGAHGRRVISMPSSALLHEEGDARDAAEPPPGSRGRAAVAHFFTKRLLHAARAGRFRTSLVEANGNLAAGSTASATMGRDRSSRSRRSS
ncbi:MAG: sigma-70 family RNA polymerase sigma factor [Rhizomicrobium sp.]